VNTKRNVYLNMKPLEEARQILFDHFPGTGTMPAETVSPPDAVGRVLAEPVTAAVSSPNFHAAAMDGVAVKAKRPSVPVNPVPKSWPWAPRPAFSTPATSCPKAPMR
jgi:molybdopterin biosynthesis enzyme